jgi:hypothetical protein
MKNKFFRTREDPKSEPLPIMESILMILVQGAISHGFVE